VTALAERAVSALPAPRGPLSACVLAALRDGGPPRDLPPVRDPYGEDEQLTLYCLYELHYRGFPGVDAEREWDLDLLRVRQALEREFLTALRAEVHPSGLTVVGTGNVPINRDFSPGAMIVLISV